MDQQMAPTLNHACRTPRDSAQALPRSAQPHNAVSRSPSAIYNTICRLVPKRLQHHEPNTTKTLSTFTFINPLSNALAPQRFQQPDSVGFSGPQGRETHSQGQSIHQPDTYRTNPNARHRQKRTPKIAVVLPVQASILPPPTRKRYPSSLIRFQASRLEPNSIPMSGIEYSPIYPYQMSSLGDSDAQPR